MKILIVSQHYWPENFRITDIAESLVLKGHDVTVLCGLPNYPQGYIFDDYKHGKNRRQVHNGVNIIRVKEIGRRSGIIFRLLNYWSYPHYASKMIKKLDNDFDVVLINGTSPIMSSKPAFKYGKKYNKPVVMYEMDLWPESLLAGDISENSLIYKHYKKVSAKLYSQCDKILVSTKEHIERIKSLEGCSELSVEYLPQYAESLFEDNDFTAADNGVIDIVFAGNIGKAQSIRTIIRSASILESLPKYKFHIVGDGSELENAKQYTKDLKLNNVVFYDSKPLEDMPYYYSLADIMIVSLENKPYANITIPGKVQSYMAAGKPIIGVVNGSCKDFIINNGIGYTCDAEDYYGLTNIIVNLNIDETRKIGNHARKVYKEKYCKDIFMESLINYLEGMCSKK